MTAGAVGCQRLEIEELVLRVPGIGRDQAPGLADAILRRVQERLRGTGRSGRLHLLALTLQVPAGLGIDELADRIADRITEAVSP